MEINLIAVLSLATFVIAIGIAIWSKRKTEAAKNGEIAHEKSSLATDGPGPNPFQAEQAPAERRDAA